MELTTSTIVIIALGGALALIGVAAVIFLISKFAKGSTVRKNAEKALLDEKVEAVIDVLVSNQNVLGSPEKAREAINTLVQIRNDNTSALALEAKKARAAKVALTEKEIAKTGKVKIS